MGLTFKYSRLSSLFAARDISGLPETSQAARSEVEVALFPG